MLDLNLKAEMRVVVDILRTLSEHHFVHCSCNIVEDHYSELCDSLLIMLTSWEMSLTRGPWAHEKAGSGVKLMNLKGLRL